MRKKVLFTVLLIVTAHLNGYAQPTCGTPYNEPYGASHYQNNTNESLLICADFPGDQVTVTFSEFDVEANNDGLYVYDGLSTSAPLISSGNPAGNVPGGLPGAYWGTSIPGPFTSSNPNGCLTFKFVSNGSVVGNGWESMVSCGLATECQAPTNLTASMVSASSVQLDWTDLEAGSGEWLLYAIPCGQLPNSDTQSTVVTSHPYIVNGLSPLTCYSFYVRAICDPSGVSVAEGPLAITTDVEQASCGGPFFDTAGPMVNYFNSSDNTTTICPETPGDMVTVTFNSFSVEAGFDGLYVFDGPSVNAPQIVSTNPAGNVPGGLAGSFWGNVNPGPFTSSSPEGCLTFRFRSNDTNNAPGWNANVSCAVANPDGITVIAFIDLNSNSVKDSNEQFFENGSFVIENGAETSTHTTAYGFHNVPVTNPGENYNLSLNVDSDYGANFSNTTTFENVSVAAGSGTNFYFFPVTVLTTYDDFAIYLTNTSPVPGFNYMVGVCYRNMGLGTLDGTITYVKDPQLTITSVQQPGTVSNPNGFTYNFTDLQPGQSRYFYVHHTVPTIPTVSLGDIITTSVSATTSASETSSTNNTCTFSTEIVGSYDPNDILEAHGPEIVHSEFTEDDYLFYTVRFQNTGTANAQTVRVENELNSELDPSTMQMLHASHDFALTRNGNQLIWQFDDIQLPPESADANGSNGFVIYRIKLNPGYAVGDIIPNTAEIYFDTNPAIVTNTFNTEFVTQLALDSFGDNKLMLSPNPASSSVQVSLADSGDVLETVTIYDILGKSIGKYDVGTTSTTLDVSKLSKGVYIVESTTAAKNRQIRKLIIK